MMTESTRVVGTLFLNGT